MIACISLNRDTVLSGKSSKGTPNYSRAEFKDNLPTKHRKLIEERKDARLRLI